MIQIKYILVLFILILAFFILFRLYVLRTKISQEGMSSSSPDYNRVTSEIATVSINPLQMPISILSSADSLKDVPLTQFFIKASYNSAYSGGYISDEMLRYVCSRACRFLDFEVYYLLDPVTKNYNSYVGYSSDFSSVSPTIRNTENITFQYMLQKALDYSFSSVSPARDDPLLIKIRGKSSPENLDKLMSLINNDILYNYNNGYKSYFYCDNAANTKHPVGLPITEKTTLGDIMRKVIFIFSENDKNTKFLNKGENTEHTVYHNMTTAKTAKSAGLYGTTYIYYNNLQPNPPVQKTVTETLNIKEFYEVTPDSNRETQQNPDIFSIIPQYGFQIVEMQYYNADQFLLVYETLFNNYSAAFVPLTYCMSFTRLYGNARDMNLGIKSFMKSGDYNI